MSNGRRPVHRILMTADTIGGVWTYALELAAALGREGTEVILATMGRPLTGQQQCEAAELPLLRLRESRFKLEWMDEPWDDLAEAGRWLLDLERAFAPDVVHLNGFVHAALPWTAPVMVVAHSCVLSWWRAVKQEPAPASWDQYREAVREGLMAADLVVVPSRAMASALSEHYAVAPALRAIPNGRNPALFTPRTKGSFVFSAGRLWDEAKNIAALGRIAAGLRWPIYVAGDAMRPDGTTIPLGELHALGTLTPAGLAEWLSRAPIFALPAKYEPFGLTVLEAALAGCALVLGDIPPLRENWDGAACFVPPHDDEALQFALNQVIADSPARAYLAACSQARALEFTHDRMAAAYREAYTEVLRNKPALEEMH
jgi:glycogen(starch) synthase